MLGLDAGPGPRETTGEPTADRGWKLFGHTGGRSPSDLVATVSMLVLAGALLSLPWGGHIDDGDAQLYQVVSRHLVEDGTLTELRYLPDVYPRFYEHLPFGFWPQAAAVWIAGEGALGPLNALWSLLTVALVGLVARRLFGARAALLAMGVLAVTETFFVYGGRPRLDPLLVMLTFASSAPVLLGRTSRGALLLASLFAAAAVLVKGPFGLLPLVSAVVARAVVDRSLRVLVGGGIAAVLALVPLCAFLLWDLKAGGGGWWEGYVRAQLFASATGARTDGKTAVLFPFVSLAGRFWPGLPLVALGLWRGVREGSGGTRATSAPRVVALSAVLMICALCLPTRKLWNHALIAYPALALLAAAGCAPWLERVRSSTWQKLMRVALPTTALLLVIATLAGAGRVLLPEPCLVEGAFRKELANRAPGTPVAVVARKPEWRLIASLAAERRLSGAVLTGFDQVAGSTTLAIVEAPFASPPPAGWRELKRTGKWVLLER